MLRAFDAVHVPAASTAQIRYDDGTLLEMGAETSVVLSSEGMEPGAPPARETAPAGKRIALSHGVVTARVARQPAGHPLLLTTPTADVQVLATHFLTWATASSTKVEVREGRVRITRRPDGASAEIAAGHVALAAPGLALSVKPLPSLKPVLTGHAAAAPRELDLSREGTIDWIHWSWNETVRIVRRKETPPSIGPLRVFDAASLSACANSPLLVSWSDGTPAAKGADVATGLALSGTLNGFQFSVPAGMSPRTLRIYAAVFGPPTRIEAALSDGSAPPLADASIRGEGTELQPLVYAIRYAAGSERQSLVVRWSMVPPSAASKREARRKEEADGAAPTKVEHEVSLIVLQAATLSEPAYEESEGKRDGKNSE
jgi:hypothetical protein